MVTTLGKVEEPTLNRSNPDAELLETPGPDVRPAATPRTGPDEHFDQFKRTVYSVTLPLIAFGVLVLFAVYQLSGLGDQPLQPLLLVIAGWFAACALILRVAWLELWPFEALTLIGLAAFILVRFHSLLEMPPAQVQAGIFIRTLVLPVAYTFVFLTLPGNSALAALTLFQLGMMAIGVARFWSGADPALGAVLAGFYTWNGVVIIVLHFFSRFKEHYVEARIRADQMTYLAFNDYLTGLPNRRGIERILQDEVERARRYNRPLSVVMVDLDHLKRINDTFGHDIGDRTLQEVATLFSRELRRTDRIGRWGGEEFIIVAPETDRKAAWVLAQRLRESLENHVFDQIGTITASYGVAAFRPGDTVHSLIKRADEALYRAKTGGRNRVEVEIG